MPTLLGSGLDTKVDAQASVNTNTSQSVAMSASMLSATDSENLGPSVHAEAVCGGRY
jgi:hypothetical protein